MTITIADFRTKIGIIIKDTAGVLTVTAGGDVDKLILSAVEFYSKRKPKIVYQKSFMFSFPFYPFSEKDDRFG